MKYKKIYRIKFLALLIAFAISNTAFSQRGDDELELSYVKQHLTKEIEKMLTETGIPSISFALIKDDSIVWADAFGYANVKKQVPATKSTIYNTGSNFKFVTATAIMQLVDAGKIKIDDPINKYLGESAISDLSDEGKPVTFRHLLSHHSGLKGSEDFVPLWERRFPETLEQMAAKITAEEAPGVNFKYCNSCYGLAGFAIEKISGQSYPDYVADHILTPLNIESKGLMAPTPGMVEELALPYTINNNQSFAEHQIQADVYPAGDIYLTPSEMANFYIAQLNNGNFKGQSILKPQSVLEMQTRQFNFDYGLGVGINNLDSIKVLGHSGGLPGYSTIFKARVNSKTAIYFASNAGNIQYELSAIGDLALKLLNNETDIKALPSFAKEVFNEIQLPEEVLETYTGIYQIAPEISVTITKEGPQLYAQVTGQDVFKIFASEKDKFFFKVVFAQIQFNYENGKIISLTIIQNGTSSPPWEKVK